MFSIVTNGTLLDIQTTKTLLNLSIKRALYTIDGPSEIHDSRRPFISGNGTFNIIFQNLKDALELGMGITLAINFDHQNFKTILKFLDFLVETHLYTNKNLSILFSTVKPGPTQINSPHFKQYRTSDKEDAEMMSYLYKEALARKLRIVDPIGMGVCTFKSATSFIIDPSGEIYKCIVLTKHEESYLGTIFEDLDIILKRLSQFIYLQPWQKDLKCNKCVFLPLCLGGCRQQALLKFRRLDVIDCFNPYLSTYIPEAIKIAYESNKIFPGSPAGKEEERFLEVFRQ